MQHGVKSEQLRALFHGGRQLKYQKNETILRARETPRGVYLIESGVIKIYSLSKRRDEHVHHIFGPGDFFPIVWPFRRSIRLRTRVTGVQRSATHVSVCTSQGAVERFDALLLACHSDHALALLEDPGEAERQVLGAFAYQGNEVLLHTDTRLMPRRQRAWSAWNYLACPEQAELPVSVTYWINRLQPLPFRTPVLVTLNPGLEPRADTLIAEFEYSHPLLDGSVLAAQSGLAQLQGERRTWYAGAWLGHGFHEDGLASAHAVADAIAERESLSARTLLRMRAAA